MSPIIVPGDLPASDILLKENVFLLNAADSAKRAGALRVAIVNLMPTKIETETQLLRLLSTPLPVEVDLIRMSRESKNTSKEHLQKFYKTFDGIKGNKYDAMIITGAPLEHLEYGDVDYWQELTQIFDFARKNVGSTMFICWAAEAALYHYYGVPKHFFKQKLSGVYKYKTLVRDNPLVKGFDRYFYAPQSRYSYCEKADLEKNGLTVLAGDDSGGVHLAESGNGRFIYIFGHSEYDELTLDNEYKRDIAKGEEIAPPHNYYSDDGGINSVWRAHQSLLFYNWLNICACRAIYANKDSGERVVRVGILGCGTVGASTYTILNEKSRVLSDKLSRGGKRVRIEVAKVFDRNEQKLKIVNKQQIAASIDEVLDDPSVDVVVELFGGRQGGEIMLKAMEKGKHVVSANKLAIATYGGALEAAAREHSVEFMYEAAVCGTIPVIRAIDECLVANTISKISGIFNGTTNYILSEMTEKGLGFGEALKAAQKAGFAESNPASDLAGDDVRYKLQILARLAFGADAGTITQTGITEVTDKQIVAAKNNGKVIKLIGTAERIDGEVVLLIEPREIDLSDPIAGVNGATNIVRLSCDNAGEVLLQGAGAGGRPTASAVISDIFAIALKTASKEDRL